MLWLNSSATSYKVLGGPRDVEYGKHRPAYANVISAEAGHDIVMVSIANGLYYGVSDVAREIWEAIEQPKKISDLVDDLTATFNIDRTRCEQETLSFLEDLRNEGLLQVSDAPAS